MREDLKLMRESISAGSDVPGMQGESMTVKTVFGRL